MKRRFKAGGKASKARGREALKTKRRDASTTVPSSAPIQDAEVARLTRELNEAREQQTAASDVLRVISSSSGQLDPVFQTILANATRICGANFGILNLHENGSWPAAAMHNVPHAFVELRRREPMLHFDPEHPLERLAATKRIMRITDLRTTAGYKARDPAHVTMVEVAGVRTVLLVPMLKDSELIGAITIYRQEVRPFAEKQIELVENFAAQAVIAIENARLLNELRQSLEQQTATADVLKVISGSLGDLQPVFRAMLANAVKICDAKFGNLLLFEDRAFRTVAVHGAPQPYLDERTREPIIRISPGSDLDRLVKTKQAIHVPDIRVGGMASGGAIIELANARTMLSVPMLKENDLVGAIGIYRQEIRPFTDKQIDLVKNFAAQAVIAIENARLLNELHQRTTDLTEALEQQTATSEVLQVISSSPGLLEEVFASMLEKAVRICDAAFGNIYRWDGTLLHLVANHNTPPAWVEYRKQKPYRADNPFAIARMINSKAPVHVTDLSDEYYTEGVRLGEIKTFLAVPMLNGDDLIGAFIVSRKEVRPFTDKQIALVHNFAAQAVIAIENARLLKELRDRTTEVERLNKHLEQRVTDQVGEIERMGRLRRFLPPQVADLIVASGTEKQLESHRRKITALFCDLRGFTGFTESADAEDVIVLLREYHAAIGEKIIKYSGTLERYAGDGVMVVFNDPVPVDNPALQAVLMALEMRDAIGALTETWHRWGHDIGFGIGIAHGFATLGTIGFEGRFDYAAIGTVSNVASRLCDEAKPGQILISPRVLTKVENAVTVEPVGEFELKGIRRPLAAYNVLAANPY
jgi:class 3 adenylate cyclase/putative methionine-R-sulfoxide reductase with GAF domain